MCWCDMFLVCQLINVERVARARVVLVSSSRAPLPPDVPTSTSPSSCHLVLSVRQRWRQPWISMEKLWASPPHYTAFLKCANSQSRTQDYLCLVVSYPSLYPLGLVTVVLLVWTRAMTQAPRIANPSEKYLSKYTFGGLTEILGCMWGVRQFRWTQRDIPLKSVSHRIHTSATLDRSS
jgi:hypothetical protein